MARQARDGLRSAVASDLSRCLVCGEPNDCALAKRSDAGAERGETSCWCVAEDFPRELVQRLSALAESPRCVCRACLARYRAGDLDDLFSRGSS